MPTYVEVPNPRGCTAAGASKPAKGSALWELFFHVSITIVPQPPGESYCCERYASY